MTRKGMKYCMVCNPEGNGTEGSIDTEAIAKYYLPKGENTFISGWLPICIECCVRMWYGDFEVKPLKGFDGVINFLIEAEIIIKQDKHLNAANDIFGGGKYNHDWKKQNLISKQDGIEYYDELECSKCKKTIRRYGVESLGIHGCTVE